MGAGYLKDRRSHFDCKELGSTPGVKFDLMGNLSKTHNITEIPKGSGRRNAHIKDKEKRTKKLASEAKVLEAVKGSIYTLKYISHYIEP